MPSPIGYQHDVRMHNRSPLVRLHRVMVSFFSSFQFSSLNLSESPHPPGQIRCKSQSQTSGGVKANNRQLRPLGMGPVSGLTHG